MKATTSPAAQFNLSCKNSPGWTNGLGHVRPSTQTPLQAGERHLDSPTITAHCNPRYAKQLDATAAESVTSLYAIFFDLGGRKTDTT
ncbi:MAG: hypothetical protein KJ749_06385 [Planctomycetes bacterium]|nr:hypothetical protein [Planctomycetota bacterium]